MKPTLRLRHPSHENALFRDGLDFDGASAMADDLAFLTMKKQLRSP
jgi:hypothetical protein